MTKKIKKNKYSVFYYLNMFLFKAFCSSLFSFFASLSEYKINSLIKNNLKNINSSGIANKNMNNLDIKSCEYRENENYTNKYKTDLSSKIEKDSINTIKLNSTKNNKIIGDHIINSQNILSYQYGKKNETNLLNKSKMISEIHSNVNFQFNSNSRDKNINYINMNNYQNINSNYHNNDNLKINLKDKDKKQLINYFKSKDNNSKNIDSSLLSKIILKNQNFMKVKIKENFIYKNNKLNNTENLKHIQIKENYKRILTENADYNILNNINRSVGKSS